MAVPDIGSFFVWCGITFQVCESDNDSCKGCFFQYENEYVCTAFHSRFATPDCSDNYHHVIFKEVQRIMTTKKLVPALLNAACLLEFLLVSALSRISEEITTEEDEKEKEKLESVYNTVDEFVNLLSSKLDNLTSDLSMLGYDFDAEEKKQFNDFNKV